jgi:hypothetical protein
MCIRVNFRLNLFLVFSVFVDLGSFQVFGIATDRKQLELSNESRPVLAQPVSQSSSSNEQKLLHVEFETDPSNQESYYRVKVVSQSLEIKYNAVRSSFQF